MSAALQPFGTAASRLALAYLAVFVAGVSLLLGVGYLLTQGELERETDLVIESELEGLRDEYQLDGLASLQGALQLRSDSWGRLGAVYLLTDPSLKRLGGNLTTWPLQGRPPGKWVEFALVAQGEDEDLIQHPVRAATHDLGGGYMLLVGTDLNQQRRFFARFRAAALWGIGLTTLLAAGIGYRFARRIGARVSGVAQTCESIVEGDLARRLSVEGSGDEFDQLAHAVNLMLDRLEQQSRTLRATFDSTAHDLRAPLHRLRMRLEEMLRAPPTTPERILPALNDVDRVQRTLTVLMQIAQATSGTPPTEAASVDLDALARELIELYEPEGRARELRISLRSAGSAGVRGSRQLLAQLLANLLENSLKYVPPGGEVIVSVSRENQRVRLVVADNGPGIPSADRERILQPFERLDRDASQPGSGLGLSLAAAVARLHRGRLTIEDNLPGLRVVCDLPAEN